MSAIELAHVHAAVNLACDAVEKGEGPFAALVVAKGIVLARSFNQIESKENSTSHAEVEAIQEAYAKDPAEVPGAILYTSCEPCIMCTAMILWSQCSTVIYAATREMAAEFGFFDAVEIKMLRQLRAASNVDFHFVPILENREPFERWNKAGRISHSPFHRG